MNAEKLVAVHTHTVCNLIENKEGLKALLMMLNER